MKGPVSLLLPFFIPICLLASVSQDAKSRTVGYLTCGGRLTREDSAVVQWLRGNSHFTMKVIRIDEELPGARTMDVLWVHIPDSASYQAWAPYLERLRRLRQALSKGGKILCTDYASFLPFELGIESNRPEVRASDIANDWLFDEKGIQGFRGHPVFSGLFGGTFLWDPDTDQRLYQVGYFDNKFPKEGNVVGVDKAYVFLHSDVKLMIEHAYGKGRVLSVGSCVYFGKKNNQSRNLKKFIENCLLYLCGDLMSGPKTYWLRAENAPRVFEVRSQPFTSSGQRTLADLPHSELLLSRDNPRNDFYDLAGRRALVMGFENGGIDELWVHPFRVLRNFQAGIVSGDSVSWLMDLPVSIEVRPESFTRVYTTPYGRLQELVFPSLNGPGAIVHYKLKSEKPVTLVIKFRSDLRWMWPYDERALGDVYYGYDEDLGALHVRDVSGDFYCVMGGDVKPSKHLSGRFSDISLKAGDLFGTGTDANQVYHAALYELDRTNDDILTIALVGTDEGKKKALQAYASILQHPGDVLTELVQHYNRLLNTQVTIESPDNEFNALFKWALVGTDRFRTTTPRLGTALVAGFATTARGWDGGQKISGRPGYAWYFGRDSEWASFALDNCGDFETVRTQLEFLQKYQDLSGKIFHEISTSGVVHYDAADATPLYVILAADYLHASGDLGFVRKNWRYLKKAMDFLYSTDTDGDGLIENTNVGHGWVEGGKLFPVHTEFYLAGLWAQALREAAFIAAHLGKKDLAATYNKDADKVVKILNKDFWNPMTACYNFGKRKDGSYSPEATVLPAVLMHFNLLDPKKVQYVLDAYANNAFSSDWGVRMVSAGSPMYDPQGYHYGSVWPLFTGWTALGEYEYGNSTQGFMHITNTLFVKNSWALGFVEEVLNGAVYKPSGVCPHQCWSETNILHPAISGMIGWKPDAVSNVARLVPRFPLHWNTVTVNNLRIGKHLLRLRMERGLNSTRYQFSLLQGGPISIAFAPEIPLGMEIQEARLNGNLLTRAFSVERGVLAQPIEFVFSGEAEITFTHTKGVGMVPVMPRPQRGDSSEGYRFVHGEFKDKIYTIELEGRSGTRASFEMQMFDQGISSVEGAQMEGTGARGRVRLWVTFDRSRNPYVRKIVSARLEEL